MSEKVNLSELNAKQKENYIKNLFFNEEIDSVIDTLLKDEKKDLGTIKVILKVLEDKLITGRIKEQCNLNDPDITKTFVYSKILGTLAFYNKTVILNSFLKNLDESELKKLAYYEYQNNTNVSLNNKTFKKLTNKYKKEALDKLNVDKIKMISFEEARKKYNLMTEIKLKHKNKIVPALICLAILLLVGFSGYNYFTYSKLIKKYDGLIYPGIYLDDINLKGRKISDIEAIVNEEKDRIISGNITVKNSNGDYTYSYSDIGISIDADEVLQDLKKYNEKMPLYKKLILVKKKKKYKTFYLNASFSNSKIDEFMLLLQKDMNEDVKSDGIVVDDNYNVSYDKGKDGFVLNVNKTKKLVKEKLSDVKEETSIDAIGKTTRREVKYKEFESIDTKISSHTTYFENAGNRGHNINLAASRLNGTKLLPEEVFSYLKVVGPYGVSNGYLPAPIYLNSEVKTEAGGGVCQLASTLYMAELKAGLEVVARRGHTFAPTYVPPGLDATVYSTTTDFKFKNQYKYPVYISAYVRGGSLTVDIWSNHDALEGFSYEPYSTYSNGGYLSYLKTIKDGQVIKTTYLDRSVYKAH